MASRSQTAGHAPGEKRTARHRKRSADGSTAKAASDTQAAPGSHRLVMVVEDDDDLRDGIEYLLEACGYEVIAAADGDDALAALRGGTRPCLILLDLFMPRKDGFEFRAEQLEDAELATIPTIAYSGIYTGSGLREKALAVGITTVIEKPVDYDTLLDHVERCCGREEP